MIPPPPERRSTRILVWIAVVIVLVSDVGYVLIIRSQEPGPPDRYTFVFAATYLAVMAAMLGTSVLRRRLVVRLRPALRAAASAGLLVIGVLALASIGIPLVVAGALSTGAAVRSLAGLRWQGAISEIAAAIVAIAVLVAGFEVTERMIVCPSTGSSGGSGYGLVTGGYHGRVSTAAWTFNPDSARAEAVGSIPTAIPTQPGARQQMVGASRKSAPGASCLLNPLPGGTKCHLYVLQGSSQLCTSFSRMP